MESRKDILYTALYINNKDKLLTKFVPKHTNHHGSHITLLFLYKQPESVRSQAIRELGTIGTQTTINIIGHGYDSKGDALLIERPSSYKILNTFPHITISTATLPDKTAVSPKYSNEMFEKYAEQINNALISGTIVKIDDFVFEPLNESIKVTSVVVMLKNRIIKTPVEWTGGAKRKTYRRRTRRQTQSTV